MGAHSSGIHRASSSPGTYKLHVLNAEVQPICRNFRAREPVLLVLSPLRNCSLYAIALRMAAIMGAPLARFTFDRVYVIVYAFARTCRQWVDMWRKHRQVQNAMTCYTRGGRE